MTTTPETAVAAPPAKHATEDRNAASIARAFDIAEAALADPSILEEIPHGATLVVLRAEDDEPMAEEQIAIGLRAVRQGRNVYFRHLASGEWTAPPNDERARTNGS